MGNTVIFKASELSPKTMWGIASIFAEAGLPAGVLNFIVHEPANAAAITASLIRNPHVKKINFTGSTVVGRIIGKLAAENLKPVLLELGGKAPAIVWEDADLEKAAEQCTLGAFLNAGQIVCESLEKTSTRLCPLLLQDSGIQLRAMNLTFSRAFTDLSI